jgi:site-specific DNA-methyltransferase (adenine-specific)
MTNSQVFNIDCMLGMANYPDKYFDLAPVDIPYGIGVGKMNYIKTKKHTIKSGKGAGFTVKNNNFDNQNWDNCTPGQSYFDELCRVSKNQIIFGIDYANWGGVGPGRIKWDKGVADGVSFKRYEIAYASMIDYEMELPLLWTGMFQAKSILQPMVQQGNKRLNEKRIHPCHKPVMLYDILLQKFGKPGYKIMDTHLGSGSSRISASKFGFEFVGFETDKVHFENQESRFKQYKSKLVFSNDW